MKSYVTSLIIFGLVWASNWVSDFIERRFNRSRKLRFMGCATQFIGTAIIALVFGDSLHWTFAWQDYGVPFILSIAVWNIFVQAIAGSAMRASPPIGDHDNWKQK